MKRFIAGLALATTACVSPVQDTYRVDAGTWELKIDRRYEKTPMGHTLYILYSRDSESSNWRKVKTFKEDVRVDIPKDHLKLSGPSTAYFHYNYALAVTSDAGKRWFVWDANKDMTPPCQWAAGINDVEILRTGSGTMTVGCVTDDGEETRVLTTTDHGEHWRVETIHSDSE